MGRRRLWVPDPIAAADDTRPLGPRLSAGFITLVAAPLGAHLFIDVFAVGWEVDSSGAVLFAAMVATFVAAIIQEASPYARPARLLAPLWPAVAGVKWKVYWALGSDSPGGAAAALAARWGWSDAPPWAATFALLLPVSAAVMVMARLDARMLRRKVPALAKRRKGG